MQCKAHVSQLGKLYGKFKEAGAEIVVILGDSLERAQEYARILKLPFPVLADPERQIYKQYGLEKYLYLIQRTASIVVDREGRVQYLKMAVNPMTWLQDNRELLQFVESMNSRQV